MLLFADVYIVVYPNQFSFATLKRDSQRRDRSRRQTADAFFPWSRASPVHFFSRCRHSASPFAQFILWRPLAALHLWSTLPSRSRRHRHFASIYLDWVGEEKKTLLDFCASVLAHERLPIFARARIAVRNTADRRRRGS